MVSNMRYYIDDDMKKNVKKLVIFANKGHNIKLFL